MSLIPDRETYQGVTHIVLPIFTSTLQLPDTIRKLHPSDSRHPLILVD